MLGLIYKLVFIFQIIYVFGFRDDVFFDEFCDCHEKEIEKIEAKCNPILEIQMKNILSYCVMDMRNKRAPYKQIDGKFKQFLICDKELEKQLWVCEETKFKELQTKVKYDCMKNFGDFSECVYTELLVNKRMEERKKKGGKKRNGGKKKNGKK